MVERFATVNESEHVQQISGLKTFGNPVPECQGGYRCSTELIAGLPAVVSNEKTFSDFLAPTNMCPITQKAIIQKRSLNQQYPAIFPPDYRLRMAHPLIDVLCSAVNDPPFRLRPHIHKVLISNVP